MIKHGQRVRWLGLFVAVLTNARAAETETPLLPVAPAGFKVELYAREPLVRNPCAMAFDVQGRLFVGQGPQYRNPKPDTPGDTIEILIDSDGDGVADRTKTFAKGLNCVQGLAWHGRDLWVANAPDLTIVRDLNGDDEADEYVRVYTDLGNIEHALHGLNWGPDGKLYMSKGTSKGLTQPGRIAPAPFRDLWGVELPAGVPDRVEPPRTFRPQDYRSTYQDPNDDWGREGGLLRCDDMGANLEIVSRGLRNPWDAGFDHGFNWLTTDNDQYDGDRIVMPFYGAHFGWSHPWSADWGGADHWPTVPMSGPVFPGSGTGKVYVDSSAYPEAYRGVWFINDWLRKKIFVYRPVWQGALLQPKGGKWEEFVVGRSALFQPVDLELGPDESLYASGWGTSYGAVFKDGKQINEGRIFRISPESAGPRNWQGAHRQQPVSVWTTAQLYADLASSLPVWRVNAQTELIRRGPVIVSELMALLERGATSQALETWGLWTLGRISSNQPQLGEWLTTRAPALSLNARLQALRIAAYWIRRDATAGVLPNFVFAALDDAEPRVRFEAVQAIWQSRQRANAEKLWKLVESETDRLTFYSAWRALGEFSNDAELKARLTSSHGGVRRAALLALLEREALGAEEVTKLLVDSDPQTASVAGLWQAKRSGNSLIVVEPAPKNFQGEMKLRLLSGIKPAALRWTTDGKEPSPPVVGERLREGENLVLNTTTHLKVALYVANPESKGGPPFKKIGGTIEGTWTRTGDAESAAPIVLRPPSTTVTVSDVLPLAEKIVATAENTAMDGGKFDVMSNSNLVQGKRLFTSAGCIGCHRVGEEGQSFGPDLTAMGDKADARHIIDSILNPNAIIAEGFPLQVITTRQGQSFSGILREETNHRLTLVQADGQPVSVEKATIATHENLHQSIMPSFASAMDAAQMADLVAWLLVQRSSALEQTLAAPSASSGTAAASTGSLALRLEADRITVTDGGAAVGTYVFSDPQILRPAWQNVCAPGGARITRPHPPSAPEAVDHATMHPGIWFALGDVNGVDFWRNKGRIVHDGFATAPAVRDGVIEFRSRNRLVAPDGNVIAHLQLAHRVARQDAAYVLTIEVALESKEHDLIFGDQEEMGLGIRLVSTLTEKQGSTMVNSRGVTGAKEAWGQIADWCATTQSVNDRLQGAAIFASPANPHASWWHTRDYGLMVANAFGAKVHPAAQAGKLTVPKGKPLVLRYAVVLFDVLAAKAPDFAAHYRALLSDKTFQP